MARVLINGVEVAINGEVVLINGDDEPAAQRPFHKETRMGTVPPWQTTRSSIPTRQSPIGSPSSTWPRKNRGTL